MSGTADTLLLTADFDGDGVRDDTLTRVTGSNLARIDLDGGASGQRITGWQMSPASWSPAAFDIDGDGRDDLAWRSTDGAAVNWLMDPGGFRVSDDAVAIPGDAIRSGDSAAQPPAITAPDPTPPTSIPDGGGSGNGGSDAAARLAARRPGPGFTLIGQADLDGDHSADDGLWRDDASGRTVLTVGGRSADGWAMGAGSWTLRMADADANGTADFVWISTGDPAAGMIWLMSEDGLSFRHVDLPLIFGKATRDPLAPGTGGPIYNPGGLPATPDAPANPGTPATPTAPRPAAPDVSGQRPGTRFTLLAQADFDGDGTADDALWREDGSNRTVVTLASGRSLEGWRLSIDLAVSIGDVNGDGIEDVIWSSPDQTFAWLMNGTGFTDDFSARIAETPTRAPLAPGDAYAGGGVVNQSDGRIDSIFYIGHSLMGPQLPAYTDAFAEANGNGRDRTAYQYNYYSPLTVNWNYRDTKAAPDGGIDARAHLATTGYDALILTPGLPLLFHAENSTPDDFVARFADLALAQNPQTEIYLLQTWPDRGRDSFGEFYFQQGTTRPVGDTWDAHVEIEYRTMLEIAAAAEQRIRAVRPDAPGVTVIPAGMAVRELTRQIDAGRLTGAGLNAADDLFRDPLHLTDLGMALVSAVTYAELYRDDPGDGQDIRQLRNRSGGAIFSTTADVADVLYDIAWDTARRY